MKVTTTHLVDGLIAYLDSEIIPNMGVISHQLAAGMVIALVRKKGLAQLDTLLGNQFVLALGVVDDQGLVDADLLADALKESMGQYANGKYVLETKDLLGKFGGLMSKWDSFAFGADDVDSAREYIRMVAGENLVSD